MVTRSQEECEAGNIAALIEVQPEPLSGINQEVEEWEELEFAVDSGAGTTVVARKGSRGRGVERRSL